MLDGSVRRGILNADLRGQIFPLSGVNPALSAERFHCESGDEKDTDLIRFDAVKSIYLNVEHESEVETILRFFDSVPIPSFLWVRATIIDGEIVEGMTPNHWTTFSGPLLSLSLPDQRPDQLQALIPRTSIAELQVITTR